MKKFAALLAAAVILAGPLAAASKDEKETDRLENCGIVLKEIMDIPDDIPQDLIDKAECVIIFYRGRQLRPWRDGLQNR